MRYFKKRNRIFSRRQESRTRGAQVFGGLLTVITLVSCGGGGGRTGAVPTAATPAPKLRVVGPTTYSVLSEPSGLEVALDARVVGKTPTSITAPLSTQAHTITLFPTDGAAPYRVSLSEDGSASSRVILYSRAADSSGLVVFTDTSQSARGRASIRRLPRGLQRSQQFAEGLYVTLNGATGPEEVRRTFENIDQLKRRPSSDMSRRPVLITRRLGGDTYFVPSVARDSDTVDQVRGMTGVVRVDYPQARFTSATSEKVNDTYFNPIDQWDLFAVSAPLAWTLAHGSSRVAIAVIDTGADLKSPDLAKRVTIAEDVSNGKVTTGQSAVQDVDGHGTNVAGIAAGDTNNQFGYASISYNVSLQIYRVFTPSGGGVATSADEALAIEESIRHGANVINLSLGSAQTSGPDPVEEAAVEDAITAGVTVVAASGNEAADTLDYPAAYPGVISIGASALADQAAAQLTGSREYVASYSNWSTALSLVAPGGDPVNELDPDPLHWIQNVFSSTATGSTRCDPNNCRAELAGTSQATPHVAAAIALMLSARPGATPSQILRTLEATADDLRDPRQGTGRLNAYRAVAAMAGIPLPLSANANNVVVFAYAAPLNPAHPTIVNAYYMSGVPVTPNGGFRFADVPGAVAKYGIAGWVDTNGNGAIDSGDWFGDAGIMCPGNSQCGSPTIKITRVP